MDEFLSEMTTLLKAHLLCKRKCRRCGQTVQRSEWQWTHCCSSKNDWHSTAEFRFVLTQVIAGAALNGVQSCN